MSSQQDFLKYLMPELREYLLSYLGAVDLLACCCVSKTWNVLVSSCETIWYRACRDFGLFVGESGTRTTEEWKKFLVEIIARKRQMKTSSCFVEEDFKPDSLDVHAVHYQDGKITIGTRNQKIMIWHPRNIWTKTFTLSWVPTSVKLGYYFLVAPRDREGIASWYFTTFCIQFFGRGENVSVVSYDFLDEYRVLAAGFEDCSLEIMDLLWGAHLGRITDHTSVIEKIVLAPISDHEQQKTFWLFTMDNDFIFVRKAFFDHKRVRISGFSAETMVTIPRHPSGKLRMMQESFTTPSLLFHDQFLYFMKYENVICKWDLEKCCLFSETRLDARVETLLGVGKKYLAFIGAEHGATDPYFFAIDKDTKETVARCYIPGASRIKSSSCIGDTDWLDGLDGENDRGVVFLCARINMPVYVLRWATRSS